MSNGVVERDAVRAILLTPDEEVLLLRIRPPGRGDPFWVAPGGGREAGETAEECLRRELQEELSLTDFVVGPLVWRRRHTFDWAGRRVRQREQYHIVHVDRFSPVITDEVEAKSIDRFHWWPVCDLAHSQERLTPLSLAAIVHDYIAQGPPQTTPAVEVLID